MRRVRQGPTTRAAQTAWTKLRGGPWRQPDGRRTRARWPTIGPKLTQSTGLRSDPRPEAVERDLRCRRSVLVLLHEACRRSGEGPPINEVSTVCRLKIAGAQERAKCCTGTGPRPKHVCSCMSTQGKQAAAQRERHLSCVSTSPSRAVRRTRECRVLPVSRSCATLRDAFTWE